MLQGPTRLAALAGLLAFGATGVALALVGLGLPFVIAALLPAVAAGLVVYVALRRQIPDRLGELELEKQIEAYRTATATMRHDLRGILSPALMMSDRLLAHQDPAVQRAGQAVIRSIDRATVVLSTHKEIVAGGATPPAP